MPKTLTKREKWFAFLRGEDVGPMVSPLCSDWNFDVPYRWPYEDAPEPYPRDVFQWQLTEQIALARLLDWEPRFMASFPFPAKSEPGSPEVKSRETTCETADGRQTSRAIATPFGDLTEVETKSSSVLIEKEWLESEEDFRKAIWITEHSMDYDGTAPVRAGHYLRDAIGDKGIMGVFTGPPVINFLNKPQMFFHEIDYPDLFQELHRLTFEQTFRRLPTLREAGVDFLFYCIDGTEWISPKFFEQYVLENSLRIFARWRELGGFLMVHSCGHLKHFIERGYYNVLLPEIMETFAEPPEGNLPSLAWARERLDPRIATMGNLPLGVLLNGTQEEVRAGVRRIREQTQGTRHIYGLGDAVLPGTPWANMQEFIEEARS